MRIRYIKRLTFILSFLFSSMAHGKALSFEDALNTIKSRSTDLPSAKANVEAADNDYLAKQLTFLPSLSAGFSKGEDLETSIGTESLYLKTNLNLFNGMSDVAKMRASKFNLYANQSQLSQVALSVEAKGTKAFIDYLLKSSDKRIIDGFKQSKEKSLKTVNARYKKGLTSKQEVMKAQVDLGIAKARLKSSRVALARAEATLKAYLGNTQVKKTWPLTRTLKTLSFKEIKNKKLVMDKNPEVSVAKYRMMRDEYNLTSSKRSFLPRLDFSYTMGSNTTNGAESNERISLITLTIPLFSNWQTYSNFKTSQAVSMGTKQGFEEVKRSTKNNFEAAKTNLIDSIQTALEREQNLKLSRSLYRANFKRFRVGKATVNDLQLDQNRLLDAESQASSGWAEAHLSYLTYCQLQGLSILNCQ